MVLDKKRGSRSGSFLGILASLFVGITVGVFLGIPVGRFPKLACADRAGPGKVHSQFFDYLPLNKFSKIGGFEQKKKWRNEAVYIPEQVLRKIFHIFLRYLALSSVQDEENLTKVKK